MTPIFKGNSNAKHFTEDLRGGYAGNGFFSIRYISE